MAAVSPVRPVQFHVFRCPSRQERQLPFGRTGTKFVTGGLALHRLTWRNHRAADHDPYWRLYLPVSGEILLHFSGEQYSILPGSLYLIPPEQDFRMEGLRPCNHYWCHFLCPSLTFVHGLQRPVSIADGSGVCRSLMRRLLKLAIHAKSFQELAELQEIPIRLTAMILDGLALPRQSIQHRGMELAEILQYIEKNLSNRLRSRELAALAGQTLTAFTARFRRTTGLPPKQYISMRRINRAKQLLLSTGEPVKQIAAAVGFQSPDLFFRLFRKYALQTPELYRKRYLMRDPAESEEAPSPDAADH